MAEAEGDEGPEQEQEPSPGSSGQAERHHEAAAPESSEPREEPERARSEPQRQERPEGASPNEARRLIERAREQLQALRGVDAESASSLRRDADGWAIALEVVEVSRIPPSTDVLASYEIVLDDNGDLVRYGRTRRYYRAQADDRGRA